LRGGKWGVVRCREGIIEEARVCVSTPQRLAHAERAELSEVALHT
jgi:hypothetical protein